MNYAFSRKSYTNLLSSQGVKDESIEVKFHIYCSFASLSDQGNFNVHQPFLIIHEKKVWTYICFSRPSTPQPPEFYRYSFKEQAGVTGIKY